MGFFDKEPGVTNDDMYVLIEINMDDVIKSTAMSYETMWKYILKRYENQPLKYFNEINRLKIVHLKSGVIKTLKLALEAV